ncbi:restriction endonuclease type II-like protein [Delphinella strobiligena]|nr:restriction endonuclease type II-like protein [Delphinella strobiligena]
MDDDFGGDDVDFGAVTAAADRASKPVQITTPASRPAPSNLDDPNAAPASRGVQQPKPQPLTSRAATSSILVSPRQKGNPILNNIRSMPWEYADIPADFVLGTTTCALFLSLKYHRLHPEYIYSRIRVLAGKYQLRIVLVMVDIENHEDPLKELSKTSIINNVTVILTWSAQEAGRYLELFKSCENAAPTSIKAQQSLSYSDKLVEFVTVPRSINKTDAVGLVSNFGSVRTAVNARPEDISLIAGWGEKKVKTWCNAVREPFRVSKTSKRGPTRENSRVNLERGDTQAEGVLDPQIAARLGIGSTLPFIENPPTPDVSSNTPDAERRPETRLADDYDPDEEEAMALAEAAAAAAEAVPLPQAAVSTTKRKQAEDQLSEGVMAALSKLRKS